MIADILIGIVVFGYAGWTLYRYVKKSKEGACASCSHNKNCASSCSTTEQSLPNVR